MTCSLKDRLAAAQIAGTVPDAGLAPVFGSTPAAQRVERLPISQLDPWSDLTHKTQPFRLYSSQKTQDMMESMSQNGLYSPIIVRPKEGRYQILAGHNRVICAKKLGWQEIDALVKPGLSDEAAADIMVDTNFHQRDRILPSEQAWGWKIKLDNMHHQGTSSHDGTRLRSDAELGESEGKGRSTIQRYIRLTRLVPALLEIVDGYQYNTESRQWELNPASPMIPLNAADILVGLPIPDQEYLVYLFQERRIHGINKIQAAALKGAADSMTEGPYLPHEVVRRCLGLDAQAVKPERPYVFKLAPQLFSNHASQYMKDIELQTRIVREIERYVAEKEGGNDAS